MEYSLRDSFLSLIVDDFATVIVVVVVDVVLLQLLRLFVVWLRNGKRKLEQTSAAKDAILSFGSLGKCLFTVFFMAVDINTIVDWIKSTPADPEFNLLFNCFVSVSNDDNDENFSVSCLSK